MKTATLMTSWRRPSKDCTEGRQQEGCLYTPYASIASLIHEDQDLSGVGAAGRFE
jgi:hypothetical protein